MSAESLNTALAALLESHRRYVARATQMYDSSIEAQLVAFTKATEQAERKLEAQLAELVKQANRT
jgi:hypothetical protein